jgi:CheY-like chemotaxis protein
MMSLRQHVHLIDDARLLVARAGDHENELEDLVASAERDLRHAEAASQAGDPRADDFPDRLVAELRRSAGFAALARRLCVSARYQHAAARRLLDRLDADVSAGEHPAVVLVVDDQSEVRTLVAGVLESAGFLVRTAANGLEGLLVAYEVRPSVIVMDVTMPVLDGIEATRLIKAAEATRQARVIAYTGQPSFDDTSTSTLFAAVLQKPATPAVVLATVRHVAAQ